MYLARGAVVLEDADVVHAASRFTLIADPPHGSALPKSSVRERRTRRARP
jgi:hypothetical protein